MSTVNFDIVRNAISSHASVVLTLSAEGTLHECSSQFLSLSDEGIVIEYIPEQRQMLLEAIENGHALSLFFQQDYRKIGFTTKILRIDEDFSRGDQTIAAMFLEMPKLVESTQRRQTYRAKAPADYGLRARVWQIPRFAYLSDQPSASHEILTEILDLSVNGVGVRLTMRDGSVPKLTPDDRLRLHLKHADWDFVLEGRIRQPHKSDHGALWTGIVFKKLENDIKGRKTLSHLTQMVGELQRREVKLLRKSQEETEMIGAELEHCAAHAVDADFNI